MKRRLAVRQRLLAIWPRRIRRWRPIVRLSPRTAAQRKAERYLKPDEADRVLRVARVVEESARVFEGYPRAAAWLRARHPLLGGATPLDLLGSDAGAKVVSDEFVRIDHGDFA